MNSPRQLSHSRAGLPHAGETLTVCSCWQAQSNPELPSNQANPDYACCACLQQHQLAQGEGLGLLGLFEQSQGELGSGEQLSQLEPPIQQVSTGTGCGCSKGA